MRDAPGDATGKRGRNQSAGNQAGHRKGTRGQTFRLFPVSRKQGDDETGGDTDAAQTLDRRAAGTVDELGVRRV